MNPREKLDLNCDKQIEDPLVAGMLIREYLRTGKIESLNLSSKALDRLLRKYDVVKTAQGDLGKLISFLGLISRPGVDKEKVFEFAQKTGLNHEKSEILDIINKIKAGQVERAGAALVIVPQSRPDLVLLGNDIAPPDKIIGKPAGAVSLPMGYSELEEDPLLQIKRVLERELFSEYVVQKCFPKNLIPRDPVRFAFFRIAHVSVECYFITIPDYMCNANFFSSSKLVRHRFVRVDDILNNTSGEIYRSGVQPIIEKYLFKIRELNAGILVPQALVTSELNKMVIAAFS